MPELPEVETIRNDLRPLLRGHQFEGTAIFWPRSIAVPRPETFTRQLTGQRIEDIGRKGKYLVFHLSDDHLLVHLRMTGRLALVNADVPPGRHTRVILYLDGGWALHFHDPRKFGRLYLLRDPTPVLGALGPDALADTLTEAAFATRLRQRRGRLKALLLNQRFLAGLGNIYTDEVLFVARLHPLRRADTLTAAEVSRLYRAIREVLGRAIQQRGTTFDQPGYRDAQGKKGQFQYELAVYGRAGSPCRVCGQPIQRLVVAQRGTYICPRCQPEAESPCPTPVSSS